MSDFRDTYLIYYSEADHSWIAHSMQTDQIGLGDRIVDALADAMRAVDQVLKAAREDPSIQLNCAPEEVHDLLADAKRLPGEISDVAHKMAHGEWPDDLELDLRTDPHNRFAVETDEKEDRMAAP